MTKEINKNEVSLLLNVSEQTIMNWIQRKGLPYKTAGGKGIPWVFSEEDVLVWYSNLNQKESASQESFDEARTRKMVAEATLAEINVEKEKGRLVEVDAVADIVADEYANVRANLLNLPQKMAPTLMGIQTLEEIQQLLEDGVNEVLAELRYDKQ